MTSSLPSGAKKPPIEGRPAIVELALVGLPTWLTSIRKHRFASAWSYHSSQAAWSW